MSFRKVIVGASLLAIMAWVLSHRVWYSTAFRARVISEGGAPVKGALVLASWRLRSPFEGAPRPPMWLDETVSDENGEFRIEGWGPKFALFGAMRRDEPIIYVLHDNYLPAIRPNAELLDWSSARFLNVSPRGLDVIQLKSTHDLSSQAVLREKEFFISALADYETGIPVNGCLWGGVPKFHSALLELVNAGDPKFRTSIQSCSPD